MKLKTNKNDIKGSRKNIRNQNNKDQIEKKNIHNKSRLKDEFENK
jgi:hypothetical protein